MLCQIKEEVIFSSWRRALMKCAVDLLPSLGEIVVIYFRLAGNFIGSELQGYQHSVKLALSQLTAKLLVRRSREKEAVS